MDDGPKLFLVMSETQKTRNSDLEGSGKVFEKKKKKKKKKTQQKTTKNIHNKKIQTRNSLGGQCSLGLGCPFRLWNLHS